MDNVWQWLLEIDITPTAATRLYKQLMEGINNLGFALNEILFQTSWMSDGGWGRTKVTGGQLSLNLTGNRITGNEAQDYAFSTDVLFAFGDKRETTMRITAPNGDQLIWPITLTNLTPGGGPANNGSAIAINIHSNGAPEITEASSVIGQLTVVSVAGTNSGDTAIYVNPAIGGGHSYKYKTGTALSIPAFEAVLTTGWTAWNGTANITATTGQDIVIAEVDGDNKAIKAGKATVTAKA